MISKEDFNKVWKDSTREDILNQFYWEHIAIRKAIEYIKSIDEDILNSMFLDESYISNYGAIDLLNILQNGSEKNDK